MPAPESEPFRARLRLEEKLSQDVGQASRLSLSGVGQASSLSLEGVGQASSLSVSVTAINVQNFLEDSYYVPTVVKIP